MADDIYTFTFGDEEDIKTLQDKSKQYDCGALYTVTPKLEPCTKEEWREFLNNYPNKLQEDFYMDAYSYNDFTIAKKWPDSIVAMAFPGYGPDDPDTFKIAKNMDEVFASIKEGKEE